MAFFITCLFMTQQMKTQQIQNFSTDSKIFLNRFKISVQHIGFKILKHPVSIVCTKFQNTTLMQYKFLIYSLPSTYYKTEKSTSLCYFEICFMHNIEGISDRWRYNSLSIYMYYIDRKSFHRLSETPSILCLKLCQNNGVGRTFWSYSR